MTVGDVLPLPAPQVDPPAPKRRKRRRLLKPMAVDAEGLSQLTPFGVRTVRMMDAAGKLPMPIRVGGRVLWLVDEIRDWLRAGAPDRETWEAMKAASKK